MMMNAENPTPSSVDPDVVRAAVRDNYAAVATAAKSSCCAPSSGCCNVPAPSANDVSAQMGYSAEELASVPEGANLGLGCGNPLGLASLKPGETVLDLGSGAGFDCFLAAAKVGPTGRVIGVDMTAEMVAKARKNRHPEQHAHVEFRLGEIENLPVADAAVDVVISNCVLNLSPDQPRVYREMFRALKPGGRIAIADVVATAEMPEEVRLNLSLHAGCISGAKPIGQIEAMLRDAGFADIRIRPKDESKTFIRDWAPGMGVENLIVSAMIEAVKPA